MPPSALLCYVYAEFEDARLLYFVTPVPARDVYAATIDAAFMPSLRLRHAA